MEKEELIKIRDDYSIKAGIIAKRKRKYVIMAPIFYSFALLLFLIPFFMINGTGQEFNKPLYFYIMVYISLGIFVLATLLLIVAITFKVIESKYKKKRDEASYKLTGLALKKYDE